MFLVVLELRAANIRTAMVTGDNIPTAVSVSPKSPKVLVTSNLKLILAATKAFPFGYETYCLVKLAMFIWH